MKLIITGATGFVGREIVSELRDENFEVHRVGNSNSDAHCSDARFSRDNFYKIDITDASEVQKLKNLGGIDAIVHSAGLAHQFGKISREKFQKTNVSGTKNILDLAVELKIGHFVLISSTAVYGIEKKDGEKVKVIDETTPCRPQTLYAESKLQAEREALEICRKNNIALTIFRLSPVIGEGSGGNVARLIELIDKKRFLRIGEGENYKSLIYKGDVARACRKILVEKKNKSEIFNLAAPPILMRDFVAHAAEKLHRQIPNFSIPAWLPELVFRLNKRTWRIKKVGELSVTVEKWLSDDVYSSEKFERDYDFKPETSILEGLEKQIARYREAAAVRGDKR